jgi:hypothetical protein
VVKTKRAAWGQAARLKIGMGMKMINRKERKELKESLIGI